MSRALGQRRVEAAIHGQDDACESQAVHSCRYTVCSSMCSFRVEWKRGFFTVSVLFSAVESENTPARAGPRTLLRETFDLSQPAPLSQMLNAESQVPLPHAPRSDLNNSQGEELSLLLVF